MRAGLAAALILCSLPRPGFDPPATPADSARAALDRAAKAMGGHDALRALRTVEREMRTETSDPTQGGRPSRPGELNPPIYLHGTRTVFADYARGRQRTTVDGAIYGNQPSRFLAVSGPDSVRIANLSLRTRTVFPAGPASAPVGQFQIEGLMRRALENPDSVLWVGSRREGNRTVDVVRFGDRGLPFALRLLFDRESGLPIAMETDNDDAVMGDVVTRMSLSDWRQVGPIRLPWLQEQRRNGVRYLRFVHTNIRVNSEIAADLYTIPAGLDPDDTPPPELKATAIGKDLYLLRGEYNSLFVVADDHVVVIEAPVNSRRSETVLAEIRRVAPGKPVRHVVATHFHSDHIGGLRPFIAEGATIVTTRSTRQVIEDFLVKGPPAPVIELAGKKRVLGDANHRIEVLDVSPNPHADEILVVWFPAERLLFEGDMLDLLVPENKPSMPGDDTRALAKSIASLGLDVDRIVAVHGRPGTRADLERTLARRDL